MACAGVPLNGLTGALAPAGLYNIREHGYDQSGTWWNSQQNTASITAGYNYAKQNICPTPLASSGADTGTAVGSATLDGSADSLSTTDPTSAVSQLASAAYPYPQVASTDDSLPDDPNADARTALANTLAQQLQGLSGTFQITPQGDGSYLVSGSNGAYVAINSDLSSGSRLVPTDANGSYTQTFFDGNGIQSTLVDTKNSDGSETLKISDATGNMTEQDQYNADGSQTQTTYGASGQITGQTQFNADGSGTVAQYDPSSGQLTEQDQFNTDGSGTQTFYDPTSGNIIGQNQINADGSQTDIVVNADGSQTSTALNAAGQETEQVQFNTDGTQVRDFYDPDTGAWTGENQIAADGSQTDIVVNADGSQTSTQLNASGQKTEQDQLNTDSSQVRDFYDPSTGALTGENQIAADGSQADIVVNADGSQTTTLLNASGQKTAQAQFNTDGTQVRDFYDPSTGALTGENQIAADGSQADIVVNADGSQTTTLLNASGQKTAQAQFNTDGTQVRDFYDPSTGALTGENQIAADGSQTDYTLNADGSQTATALNAAGQETGQVQFNTDGTQVRDFYNPATGALTGENQIAADGSQTDYTLNADGSQTATLLNTAGQQTGQVQFNTDGTQVRDFYDPATGALTGQNQIAADGSQTDYTLNADGSQTATLLNTAGQQTEQVQFNTDGTQTQSFYNPSTGSLTGENQIAADGSQTDIVVNADGSQTATALNAAGQETQWAQFNPDGSADEKYYSATDGQETGEKLTAADGSQQDYVFQASGEQDMTAYNAAGQETENAQFQANGAATIVNYDPSTGAETTGADLSADGSQVDYSFDANGGESVAWYNPDGAQTQTAQVNGDTTTYDYFNPGANYASEEQVYQNGQLAGQDSYDPDTGELTQSVALENGAIASVTNYSSTGIDQTDYDSAGNATGQTWYDANGAETQYAQYDGATTMVDLFQPGAQYASQTSVYKNGLLAEIDNWDTGTGALQQVSLYNGGAYPYETQTTGNGPYFSQIEQVDPDTGSILGTADYDSGTGMLTGDSGSYADGGYDGSSSDTDSDYDDLGDDDDDPFSGLFGDDGDDDGGFFGFAGSQPVVSATLAAGVNPVMQTAAAAQQAERAALQQARQSADGSAGQASVTEGATWGSKKFITWNLAADGSGDAARQAAEKAAAQQAFAAWGTASGLTFEQVSGPADISIGWGGLNTAQTGVAGYTTVQAGQGLITAARIELERPGEDALVSENGTLTYSGTQATLQQVLEHEIGHALGLADTSNPNSIMYYELTPANRTLGATDQQGIRSLYAARGVSAAWHSSGSVAAAASLLIQGMASFAPARGVATTTVAALPQHATLLAVSARA